MNLAALANLVTKRIGMVQDRDVAACKLFLGARHDQLWRSRLWRNSVIEYTLAIDPDATYDATSPYLPVKGILLLPTIFEHVLAVRSSEHKLSVQRPMLYYRVDTDTFVRTGTPLEYFLLPACVWEFDADGTMLLRRAAAADAGVSVSADLADSDNVGVTRSATLLTNADNLILSESERVDGLTKRATEGAVSLIGGAYCVIAGAGTAAANVTLSRNGTWLGRPYYGDARAQAGIQAAAGQGGAVLWNGVNWHIFCVNLGWYSMQYYSSDDVLLPQLATTWTAGPGNDPAPTVTGAGILATIAALATAAARRQRIRLVDIPDAATTIRVLGKRIPPSFSDDNDTPGVSGMEGSLAAFAYYDMLHRDERGGTAEAQAALTEAAGLVQALENEEVLQGAHNSRIVPESGFGTDEDYIGPQF